MQTKQKAALGLDGTRTSGLSVRQENVTAALSVAHVVSSSLGPIGLDKMLVDEIGDVCVTNDGATIVQSLSVSHPAGRLLVDLARLQDKEIGDGTTSVVLLASELLKRAQELVMHSIHATSIISGYKLALKEALRFVQEHLTIPVSGLIRDVLLNVARTSMSSKIIHTSADVLAPMVVEAIESIKTVNSLGDVHYPRQAVSIILQHGKSARESQLIKGFALQYARAAQGMPTHIADARIALVDFDLRAIKMKLGIQIVLTDPTKAEAMRQRELDVTKERLQKIIQKGANVIITSWGMEDSMMKYLVDCNVLGVRRVPMKELRRLAKATGATIVHSLSNLDGEEVFEEEWLGRAKDVREVRCGEDEIIVFEGTRNEVCASLLCRGANYLILEEMERALNDALWAVARTCEAREVVAGGGATEVALSMYLDNFARTLSSREQLAVAAFAEALLIIPKTLALNAALDATDLVARLCVEHAEAQKKLFPGNNHTTNNNNHNAEAATGHHNADGNSATNADKKDAMFLGLDLHEGCLRNNLQSGVLEPKPSKVKSLQFATEAAITILRIDDCIRLNPEEEEGR